MKPVLKFEEDGKIHPLEKVRTRKRAYNSIEQHALEYCENINDVTVFVINGDKIKEGKDFCAKLKEKYSNINIQYCEYGPVIASHLGSGGIGVGYFPRKIVIE
ncbi:DegV family protein [Streptococcus pneumoniae]|uniref:DegV family protein n=1 Tax=Streptococcus pneumoniae TaxID=1313 RepID=UPI0021D4C686